MVYLNTLLMCLMYSGTLASNSEQEKTTKVEERPEWSPSQAKQMPSKYPPPCARQSWDWWSKSQNVSYNLFIYFAYIYDHIGSL